jgi:hypothetical protein
MKSLPNSTNSVIVLSDSFATSIFKQSFLRVLTRMIKVTCRWVSMLHSMSRFVSSLRYEPASLKALFPVHERAQSLWYIGHGISAGKKITLRWRNRDWYWPDLHLENQRPLTTNCHRRLLRSRHPRRPTPLPWLPRPHPIRHSLLARLRANASALDYCCAQLR